MNKFEEWAKWAKSDHARLQAVSSYLLVMRSQVPLCYKKSYHITDDEAMAIDSAVTHLAKHSLVLWHVFILYHIHGWSLRHIAKAYLTPIEYPQGGKRVSEHTANAMLNRAEGVIVGILS
ncbi:antiterminator Q family protein [Acinetobacter sp. c3-l95]|uniref:antiterminator Q family protein n=1 Tax=Acinetobacter sp. c3-l95 TaxID=3342804 RepID=UPI0035BA4CE9